MIIPTTRIRITAQLSASGVPADPTVLTFTIRCPDQSVKSLAWTAQSPGSVIRVAKGQFAVDWEADQSGTYTYKFQASGSVLAAQSGSFRVDKDPFTATDQD